MVNMRLPNSFFPSSCTTLHSHWLCMRVLVVLRKRESPDPLPLLLLAILYIDCALPRPIHLRRLLCELHRRNYRRKRTNIDFVLPKRRVADKVSPHRPLNVYTMHNHIYECFKVTSHGKGSTTPSPAFTLPPSWRQN